MLTISKEFTFDASHYLHNDTFDEDTNKEIYGKCSKYYSDGIGHGHTYKMIVKLMGDVDKTGMMINFKDLKNIVNTHIIDKMDHKCLNNIEMFKGIVTTCENMSEIIFHKLELLLNNDRFKMYSIILYETPTSYCEYKSE